MDSSKPPCSFCGAGWAVCRPLETSCCPQCWSRGGHPAWTPPPGYFDAAIERLRTGLAAEASGHAEDALPAVPPHAFVKNWLDCCEVCGQGIEWISGDGVHSTPDP